MPLSFKQHIKDLFKNSQNFSDSDKNLDIPKILESIEKIDIELIKILKDDEKAKKEFFTQIDDIYVLNQNKLIEFFTLNDYMKNGSFTAYSNKIGLIRKDNFIKKFDDVILAFPHKDCVLEGGQTKDDDKKKETFYNEIISSDEINRLFEPKVLTNIKRYSKNGVEENCEIKNDDNLIIKGNNLIALHSLKKKFAGKVKLIYIDPPYNTGSDSFGYNDNFNHSTWLTFMKNRLEIAREFLYISSGVIAVQCSFHEYPYLKVLMDEIYDKNNYKCTFHIKVRHPDRVLTGDKEFNDVIEYILFYSRNQDYKFPSKKELKTNEEYIYKIELLGTPEFINCGSKVIEVYTPEKYKQILCEPSSNNLKTISVRGSIREKNSSGRFYVKYLESLSNEYPPLTLFKVPDMGDDIFNFRYFHLPKDGNKNGTYYQGKPTSSEITIKPYANFYDFEKDYNIVSSDGDIEFRNGKKPESLLSFLIELFTQPSDLIMDYHLGSGTTCAVAHKMGRRYIGIEQMDYIEDIAVVRIKNVIDGEQGGISKAVNWNGGGDFVYAELKTIDTFKDVEIGALNKNMQYLPISEIEDDSYNIGKEEIAINKAFYGIENE